MVTLSQLFDRSLLVKDQISVVDVFNVPDTLRQKGFDFQSETELSETLLNSDDNELLSAHHENSRHAAKQFLEQFNNRTFRARLRRRIFENSDEDDFTVDLGKLHFESNNKTRLKFSKTMELLIAFLCVEKLSAFSASFGVKLQGAPCGGDYDCIANFQNSLYHFEVKAGKTKNLSPDDFKAFLARHDFLSPDASILFLDYQGIDDNFISRFGGLEIGTNGNLVNKIFKIEADGKRFFVVAPGIIVLDVHRNGDILANLKSAMQYLGRFRAVNNGLGYLTLNPKFIGFNCEVLYGPK